MELINDYKRLILAGTTLIDLRAPVEFASGALPGATNLPLMTDEERHQVGLCYKKRGRQEALELGRKLVSGIKKEKRIAAWVESITINPETVIYCSRGGLRSEIAQSWIKQRTGKDVARLEGGYKAVRNFLLASLDPAAISSNPVVLGGRTGTGKTLLLKKLKNSVDLEKIAHHRGSSFGRFITPQPVLADFENRLAAELIKHQSHGFRYMIVEDEGRHVGRCYLPRALSSYFSGGRFVLLENSMEQRVQITFDEYVLSGQKEYQAVYGLEPGLHRWRQAMEENTGKISKRLGLERLIRVRNLLGAAHAEQLNSGNPELHKAWLEMLIKEYYDPMYDYQLQKRTVTVTFKGDFSSVLEYLQTIEY